ncbi:MAG: EF-hand domain-containing protein [Phycisphaeraceae bacterium]|nr:EF-hand domain-containing protein [Phycisphaeraceae bacterium]
MQRKVGFLLITGMIWAGMGVATADDLSGPEPVPSQPTPAERAQAEQTRAERVPDLLPNHIDPFNINMVRPAFLRAAGMDMELNRQEFEAAQQASAGVVFSYDRWEDLLRFDANGNGTIDWFEFQAYRTDVRGRVIAAFDENGDGRLTGQERIAANRALAAGRLPGRTEGRRGGEDRVMGGGEGARGGEGAAGRRGGGFGQRGERGDQAEGGAGEMMQRFRQVGRQLQELRQQFDPDGTGEMTDEQREAMWAQAARIIDEEVYKELDADGDGVISPEEMRAGMERAREAIGEEIRRRQQEFIERFDSDGDGQLSEADMRRARDTLINEQLMRRFAPDGDPTPEQQAQIDAARERWTERANQWEARMREAGRQWEQRFQHEDGTPMNEEERAQAMQQMREQFEERTREMRQQWERRFQREDGTPMNEEERAEAMRQMREQWQQRMRERREEGGERPMRGRGGRSADDQT